MKSTLLGRFLPLVPCAVAIAAAAPSAAQCQVDKFIGSTIKNQDQFAYALALEGTTAIAGAFKSDDAAGESGSAYVFEYDGYGWTETAILFASDGQPFDHLGWDVDIDPDNLVAVAGAPDDDDLGSNSGSAYVFFDNPMSGWEEYQKVLPNDASANDQFGFSVAVRNTTLIVGAPGHGNGGAVYVFERQAGNWNQVQKLVPGDLTPGSSFGFSLAFDGVTLAIGANRWSSPTIDRVGKAYVYTRSGGTQWALEDTVVAHDGKLDDHFASAITLDRDRMIVGAVDDDDQGFSNNSNSGVAFHFTRTRGQWGFEEKVKPPVTSHGFSTSLEMEDDWLVVGSFLDKEIGMDAGAGHVFELVNLPAPPAGAPQPRDGISDRVRGN